MAITAEGKKFKTDFVVGIFLEALPPGKAAILFTRVHSMLEGLTPEENSEVTIAAIRELHTRADAYYEQMPDPVKKFLG